LLVHIGDPSSNQATTLESQMIHMIQELFGQTLTSEECCHEQISLLPPTLLFVSVKLNSALVTIPFQPQRLVAV
jgi:hypothetical protein